MIGVGLVVQERQATTLICRANYEVMRGIVDFLVAECCVESACEAPAKPARRRKLLIRISVFPEGACT